MMFSAFTRALGQLPDPAFRSVLLRSVLLAIVVFVGVALLAGWWLSGINGLTLFGVTILSGEWLGGLGGFAALLLTAWLFFPAVASLVLGFFLEDVVDAVDRRHYPVDLPGRSQPFFRALWLGLRFAVVLIVLNLLALPLYLFPVINIVVYLLLNGYLLGREYFELVGFHHMDPASVTRLGRQNRAPVFIAGVITAGFFAIPFVNLVAPLIATAAMTHIFKDLRRA